MGAAVKSLPDAPAELRVGVSKYWPVSEWENALSIAWLESAWSAFALNDTTSANTPCGAFVGERDGELIVAERSVGYFQINSCNFPDWEWQRLYNADHNCGTAHMLWEAAGKSWSPW